MAVETKTAHAGGLAHIPEDGPGSVGAGYCVGGLFPAPGLRRTVRHITGHNEKGQSIFLATDSGDHHREMGNQQAVANILYSTQEHPANLNDGNDIKKAKDAEVN